MSDETTKELKAILHQMPEPLRLKACLSLMEDIVPEFNWAIISSSGRAGASVQEEDIETSYLQLQEIVEDWKQMLESAKKSQSAKNN
jgi:hypothetical protein